MATDAHISRGSGVRTPPPLLYAFFIVTGLLLQKFNILNQEIFQSLVSKSIGLFFMILALAFLFKGFNHFFQEKTTVLFSQPAATLITTGIFGITRNPIYMGFNFVYLGLMCLIGNWWHVILFPILILIMQEYVIRREEDYLIKRFGQKYLDYKFRVRRWL